MSSTMTILPRPMQFYAAFVKEGKFWTTLSNGPQLSAKEAALDLKYWARSAPASMEGKVYEYRIMKIVLKVHGRGKVKLIQHKSLKGRL